MPITFDDIANQFDDQRGLPRPAIRAWMDLIDGIASGHNLHVIEPGIGTGRLALPLVAMGHLVTGVDISNSMLEVCRQRSASICPTGMLNVAHADATDLPYDDYTFDLGIIAQLLYLIPDWPMVLDELARVVKPGGYVVHLTEPTMENPALQLWSFTWRRLIEKTNYQHTQLSPTDDDVRAEFLRRWPDVQEVELASWQFGQTVSDAKRDYGARLRALYGSVPGSDYEQAVSEFLAWAEEEFPDADQMLDGRVTLKALVASL